jgi:hypothetical protein
MTHNLWGTLRITFYCYVVVKKILINKEYYEVTAFFKVDLRVSENYACKNKGYFE